MTEHLIINIPSSTACRYIIATDTHIDHPEVFTINLLATNSKAAGEQSATLLRQVIGTSELRIRSHAANDSPCQAELAYVAASKYEDELPLSAASRHIVIDSETSPTHQPHQAQLVRDIARELADATAGQLADLCTAELIRPQRGVNERDLFCPADGWVGIDCRINGDGGMDAFGPTKCECLCLFTRGLSRFGLPELVIDRVACGYDLAATNVLRGLAVRLLRRLWADPAVRELRLAESVVVEPEDVWGFWGARPLFGLPVPLLLATASRDDLPEGAHLELLPRPDFPGTRVEWGTQILNEGVSSVAAWQPDTPPYRIDRPVPHASLVRERTRLNANRSLRSDEIFRIELIGFMFSLSSSSGAPVWIQIRSLDWAGA